jgi:hypothetical protein
VETVSVLENRLCGLKSGKRETNKERNLSAGCVVFGFSENI